MESGLTSLKLLVKNINYLNIDSGFAVLQVSIYQGSEEFTLTTKSILSSPQKGQIYEAWGEWVKHPKFGKQFQATRLVNVLPTGAKAISQYLSSGLIDQIGPKTAKAIVKVFGENTFSILDHSPEKLLEVSGIGTKKLEVITEGWKQQSHDRTFIMFLQAHSIPLRFASKLLKKYGSEATNLISSNPYRLIYDIRGIGFHTADSIARSVGISPESPDRLAAGVIYLLQNALSHGHTFLTFDEIQNHLLKLLALSEEHLFAKLPLVLNSLESDYLVICEKIKTKITDINKEGEVQLYYLKDLYFAEINVAKKLASMMENKSLKEVKALKLKKDATGAHPAINHLSAKQNEAVARALSSSVFILTGGPGVGKTTTAKTIISFFKEQGKKIALCAPTGRAAQRLSEVSQMSAQTIHRLLQWKPDTFSFNFNEQNPLDFDVIFVDEASMIDINLAWSFFSAIKPTTQVIIIGDVDQLPSVGPGNVLFDLLKSGIISSYKLDEVFRQAAESKIISSAHEINQGKTPNLDNSTQRDCYFMEYRHDLEAQASLIAHCQNISKMHPSPLSWQVLAPMKKGPLGTKEINQLLQEKLNPPGSGALKLGEEYFSLGDKVIQTSNNYELNVFNGDIGIITAIEPAKKTVKVAFFDKETTYSGDQAWDLKLAYAITIHKSQGSEFSEVVIPLSLGHYILLQRNLIYTALTRAKNKVAFFGNKKALRMAVERNDQNKRHSLLAERLRYFAHHKETKNI